MGKLELVHYSLGNSARYNFYNELKKQKLGEALLIVPNSTMLNEAQKAAVPEVCVFDAFLKKFLNKETQKHVELSIVAKTVLMNKAIIEVGQLKALNVLMTKNEAGKVIAKAGLADSLLALRRELKNYCIDIQDVAKVLPDKSILVSDVDAIFKVFDDLCVGDDGTLYEDMETKYEYVIKCIISHKWCPYKKIYLSDFYKLTPLQLKLIETIKNNTDTDILVGMEYDLDKDIAYYSTIKPCYDKLASIADKISDLKVKKTHYKVFNELRANFTGTYASVQQNKSDRIALNSFVNREAEIRWTLAEIKHLLRTEDEKKANKDNADKLKANEIVIAVRDLDKYSQIREIADEYGIYVSVSRNCNITGQPIAEFLTLLFTAAMDDDKAAKAYFKLMNCSLMRLLEEYVPNWTLGMPTECYFTKRSYAKAECDKRVIEYPERYKEVSNSGKISIREKIDKLINDIEIMEDKSLNGYVAITNKIIKDLALEINLGEQYKFNKGFSVQDLQSILLTKKAYLKQLELLNKDIMLGKYTDELTPGEYIDLVNEYIKDYAIVLQKGRNDGVKVMRVVDLQGCSYKYVYLLGVREGEFPAKIGENWIIDDASRSELRKHDVYLTCKEDLYNEDCYFFANAIATAEQKLILSWFRDEGVSEEEPYRGSSLYIGYVKSMFKGLEEESVSYVDITSKREAVITKWKQPDAFKDVIPGERLLLSALDYSDKDDEKRRLRKHTTEKRLSASALKKYDSCPLGYLAEKVWGVNSNKEKDENPSATNIGTFIHEVFELFVKEEMMKTYKGKSFAELSEQDRCELGKVLMNKFDTISFRMEKEGAFGGPLWDLKKETWRRKVKEWFDFECNVIDKMNAYHPVGTEWKFGYEGQKEFAVNIDTTDENGKSIQIPVRFCGTVDRIDASDKYLYITDYKTGEAPGKKDLQVPLYTLALAANYEQNEDNKHPIGGSYLELKKNVERKSEPSFVREFEDNTDCYEDILGKVEKMISDILLKIYEGKFDYASAQSKCSYCAVKPYCGRK